MLRPAEFHVQPVPNYINLPSVFNSIPDNDLPPITAAGSPHLEFWKTPFIFNCRFFATHHLKSPRDITHNVLFSVNSQRAAPSRCSVPHGPVRPVRRVNWTWTTTCSPVRVLTWTDQSSVHLGLDGLQATQAPEVHSKILCNIFIYKASATIHDLHFAYAPPLTIIPYFALLPGDFPMPLGYFSAAPGQTRLILDAS
jgi:hypothetical protein